MSDAEQPPPATRWVAPSLGGDPRKPGTGPMTADRLEAIQKDAYDEAYTNGLEAGRRAGKAELDRRLEEVEAILGDFSAPLRELDQEVEEALVGLAVRVARQIIRRELKTDPDHIVGVVRDALAVLPVKTRGAVVHLHPKDATIVKEAFGEAGREFTWTLVDDPALARGGLRVTADSSQIDARVEARLDSILASLVGDERSAEADPAPDAKQTDE